MNENLGLRYNNSNLNFKFEFQVYETFPLFI